MKILYRMKSVNKVRAALSQSLLDIFNVLVVLIQVWLVFGVFGIALYRGQFGFCENKMSFGINKEECVREGRQWVNYKHNFDDIRQAIPTLFVIASLDGWGEIL